MGDAATQTRVLQMYWTKWHTVLYTVLTYIYNSLSGVRSSKYVIIKYISYQLKLILHLQRFVNLHLWNTGLRK